MPVQKKYTLQQAAEYLGITGRNIDSRCIARLVYLGYTETCGRCGGSGNYSYNQMDGTRCFGCHGTGKHLLPLTDKLLADAKAKIDAGMLEPYLKRNTMRNKVRLIAADARSAWMNSTVAKEYNAHRTPNFGLDEGAREKHYDEFFASPLFIINSKCGDLFKRSHEIETEIANLNWFKDGEKIDALIVEIEAIKAQTEELDRQYVESKTNPVPPVPVFAAFRVMGTPHFVRCSAATSAHKHMAQDFLRKKMKEYRSEYIHFDSWVESAPEFHDMYPRPDAGEHRQALSRFLTDLSESREVVENAVRD